MPTKNTNNKSILIDKAEFLKAKKSSTEKDLEKHLIVIMKLANEHYDAVYHAHQANPDIKEFSYCRENFKEVKSIIESKKNPTQLTNKFYLEAWISMLYSDVHALNLDPATQEQLDELNKKIEAIGTDFNKLQTEKSCLDSNDKNTARLLKYIDAFKQSWETKEKRLIADSHYNFAETLVEKSKIELEDKANGHMSYVEDAKKFLTTAANFYKQANLLDFAVQTKQRIKELEKNSKELQDSSSSNHFASLPDKKLVVVLTRLSPTLENKGKTESLWTASYKKAPTETLDKLPEVVDQSILPLTRQIAASHMIKPIQRKRKSSDNDIKPAKKIKCETECTKLLNEFEQIGIEKYNLSDPFCKEELIRYKASLASKFALDIIENLSFPNKNLSDTEKLYRLQEAQNGFSKSIGFYNQVKEVIEKEKINQCINILTSTIKKLNTSVNKPKEPQTKPTMPLSNVKFFEYQGTYSARLACKFFKDSSTDTPINNQNLSLKLNSPH